MSALQPCDDRTALRLQHDPRKHCQEREQWAAGRCGPLVHQCGGTSLAAVHRRVGQAAVWVAGLVRVSGDVTLVRSLFSPL